MKVKINIAVAINTPQKITLMRKNWFLLSMAALVLSVMVACSGAGGGDPKSVAKKFFEALTTMNIEEASKYATKDSKSMLDLMKMGMTMAPQNMDSLKAEMAKQKIEYSDPVINGDEATLAVTVDGKEKTNFRLKKEDGAWKVAFDKNSLMKTGMEKMEEKGASPDDLNKAMDAMNQLSGDSLQDALKEAGKAMEEAGEQMKEAGGKIDSLMKRD